MLAILWHIFHLSLMSYWVQLFRCVVSIQLQQVEEVVVCYVVLKKYEFTNKLLALECFYFQI